MDKAVNKGSTLWKYTPKLNIPDDYSDWELTIMSVSLQYMQHTEQQESKKQRLCIFPSVWAEVWTIATPLLELVLLLFDPLTVKQEGWNAMKVQGQIQGHCAYVVYIYPGHNAPIPPPFHPPSHPHRKKKQLPHKTSTTCTTPQLQHRHYCNAQHRNM